MEAIIKTKIAIGPHFLRQTSYAARCLLSIASHLNTGRQRNATREKPPAVSSSPIPLDYNQIGNNYQGQKTQKEERPQFAQKLWGCDLSSLMDNGTASPAALPYNSLTESNRICKTLKS